MIDAHVHIWDLSRGETLIALRQFPQLAGCEFLPTDLETMLAATGADSAVLVHGPATIEHTQFCLSLAKQYDCILSVIGWLNVRAEDPCAQLKFLATDEHFIGIRLTPMLDEEPEAYLSSEAVTQLAQALGDSGHVLEVLAPVSLLPLVHKLALAAPQTDIVIAHFGLPDVTGDFKLWCNAMRGFSSCPHVHVKVSGLLLEGGCEADRAVMMPYMDVLLHEFQPERMLYASNWPVMTAVTQPEIWLKDMEILLGHLTSHQRQAVFHDNAISLYTPSTTKLTGQ